MKSKIYFFFLLLFVLSFTACQSDMKYPDKLPEACDIQSFVYEGVTTKNYYDKDGNIFKCAYYNTNNELINDPESGVAEIITLREDGIVIVTYYDKDKNPVINKHLGYARSRYAYNEFGLQTEETYYDTDHQLIIPTLMCNYAMLRYEYDANGNQTKCTLYDAKKKVILPITVYTYDENQQNTKVSFVDEKGNLMLNKDKYAYIEYKYGDDSMSEYSYHDTKGNLVLVSHGDDDYEVESGDEENIPHARGKWIYTDTATILRIYNTNNQLIKEYNYSGYDGGDDYDTYKVINDESFEDRNRMDNLFTFLTKCELKLNAQSTAFQIIQNWSMFCFGKQNGYSESYQWQYEPKDWEKDSSGKKYSSDEARSRFDNGAQDLFYVTEYFISRPDRVLSAFKHVKPLIKIFVPKDTYTKSGAGLLVNTALTAYDDIQNKGAEATLKNINLVMKKSEDSNFYQTSELYAPMKEYISMSISDIDGKLREEEKKEVIVWAYSFWLRRNNEQAINTAHTLLKEIKELYK